MHQASAEEIAERISIIGQDYFGHLRLRFADRTRFGAVSIVRIHVSDFKRCRADYVSFEISVTAPRRLSFPPLQVHGQVAFCLSLCAFIAEPHRPALPSAVVLQLSALHRGVITLVNVIENEFVSAVAHHYKAQAISAAHSWQPRTTARVAQIAKITQLVIGGI